MKSLLVKVAVSVTVSVVGTMALNYISKKTGSKTKWTFIHIEM